MTLRFGSVCSGIEAASVAWHPLGWRAAWFSEIEPFPCAALAHHYPAVPNHGDMTLLPDRILSGEVEAPDVFCGGTPCQAFSVAGNRRSLDDARGNLSLTFCEIANAIDDVRTQRGDEAAIIFWENVPGVLNTKDNAFGCFLGELSGEDVALEPPGGRWTDAGVVHGPERTVAWRVLDAQYFGLAQRRKRVFVVASSRAGFNPAEVLLEFDGVRRDFAPSREARKGIAGNAQGGAKWPADVACTLNAAFGSKQGLEDQHALGGASLFVPAKLDQEICGTLTAGFGKVGAPEVDAYTCIPWPVTGFNCAGCGKWIDGSWGWGEWCDFCGGDRQAAAPIAFKPGSSADARSIGAQEEIACTLEAGGGGNNKQAVAIPTYIGGIDYENNAHTMDQPTGPLMKASPTGGGRPLPAILTQYAVRRLTPIECERLQGFPDGYTNIPWRNKPEAPDGPRYKALGNSWAVPVVRWIGGRINSALQPSVEDSTL
jgi:DNA (cytosine-5)-methyltransferase 1